MKKVKITILKTMLNEDLAKEYGICGLKACDYRRMKNLIIVSLMLFSVIAYGQTKPKDMDDKKQIEQL